MARGLDPCARHAFCGATRASWTLCRLLHSYVRNATPSSQPSPHLPSEGLATPITRSLIAVQGLFSAAHSCGRTPATSAPPTRVNIYQPTHKPSNTSRYSPSSPVPSLPQQHTKPTHLVPRLNFRPPPPLLQTYSVLAITLAAGRGGLAPNAQVLMGGVNGEMARRAGECKAREGKGSGGGQTFGGA